MTKLLVDEPLHWERNAYEIYSATHEKAIHESLMNELERSYPVCRKCSRCEFSADKNVLRDSIIYMTRCREDRCVVTKLPPLAKEIAGAWMDEAANFDAVKPYIRPAPKKELHSDKPSKGTKVDGLIW